MSIQYTCHICKEEHNGLYFIPVMGESNIALVKPEELICIPCDKKRQRGIMSEKICSYMNRVSANTRTATPVKCITDRCISYEETKYSSFCVRHEHDRHLPD